MQTAAHDSRHPLPGAALHRMVAAQRYPMLFATISGAHLYGFPSADSDFDIRGAHVLPLETVIGLHLHDETIEDSRIVEEPVQRGEGSSTETVLARLEMDIVSHDIKKFFELLLKKNGYVLEQLYSPLIVNTTAEHTELKRIAHGCITRHHAHHYFGFAETQWKLFDKERPRRLKPLLYVYRVLLTGIHLMRSGVIHCNLLELNTDAKLPYLEDLVARKGSAENGALPDGDVAFHHGEYERLRAELQKAHDQSKLPELPTELARTELNELLIQIRLGE